jgi:hypothetical protein
MSIGQDPGGYGLENSFQRPPPRGHLILYPRRNRRVNHPHYQTISLEVSKSHDQHSLRYTIDGPVEFVEAHPLVSQYRQKCEGPRVSNAGQDLTDKLAVLGTALISTICGRFDGN